MAVNRSILLLSCLVTIVSSVEDKSFSTSALPGDCPQFNVQPNYNNFKASGFWYGVDIAFKGQDVTILPCYRFISYGNVYGNGLIATALYKDGKQIVPYHIQGTQSGSKPGNWIVETSNEPGANQTLTVLATDYQSYLTFARCKDIGQNQHSIIALVLSRTKTLSKKSLTAATAAIRKSGIDATIHAIPQRGC